MLRRKARECKLKKRCGNGRKTKKKNMMFDRRKATGLRDFEPQYQAPALLH